MNKLKFFLSFILLIATIPVAGASDSPQPKFSKVYHWNDFEYLLLTPEILEMMPDKLSAKELSGISASKLKLVEIVKTPWHGKSKEVRELVKSLVDEPGWQQVSVQKRNNNTTLWYIKKGGGDKIKEILVLKYTNWDSGFDAMYLVGNLTTADLKTLFK